MSNEQELLRTARDAEGAGDTARARSAYESVVQATGRHAQAAFGLARLDLAEGRAAEALAWLENLVPAELDSGARIDLFLMRAAGFRMLSRPDDEAQALQTALAHDP